MNGNVQVFLPNVDEDVVFVFSHILQHFFQEGVGLRQVCDWCRLLWTYKEKIDQRLLETRLKNMGVMSEWKVFSSLAVNMLGMPAEAMPFFSPDSRWQRKSLRVMERILETGNFGSNRDLAYYKKYSFLLRKCVSLWRHTLDSLYFVTMFPLDSLKVWCRMVKKGINEIFRKKHCNGNHR